MTAPGWRPLQKPPRQNILTADASPFTRFARVHALSSIGDGLVTIALAGSIFFSVDPSAARNKVALYLFLTIAPFAVVTPLIGPAVDRARGGRRTMVLATTLGRAVVLARNDGVFSRLNEASGVGCFLSGAGQSDGGVRAETHFAAPTSQGKAIDPTLRARWTYLKVKATSVAEITRRALLFDCGR